MPLYKALFFDRAVLRSRYILTAFLLLVLDLMTHLTIRVASLCLRTGGSKHQMDVIFGHLSVLDRGIDELSPVLLVR